MSVTTPHDTKIGELESHGHEEPVSATTKIDHPPLLDPGVHIFTLQQLRERFVDPFRQNGRRLELLSRFTMLISRIRDIGIPCDIWLDGSFVTTKEEPDDLDVVVFISRIAINGLSKEKLAMAYELQNRPLMRARYACDIYVEPADEQERRIYWVEKMSKGHNGVSNKGIAIIRIQDELS